MTARAGASASLLAPDYGQVAERYSPPAVVAFIVGSGVLQALYWVAGGDYARRVLLAPLFYLLARWGGHSYLLPDGRLSRETGRWLVGALSGLWLGIARVGRCGRQTRRAWK